MQKRCLLIKKVFVSTIIILCILKPSSIIWSEATTDSVAATTLPANLNNSILYKL